MKMRWSSPRICRGGIQQNLFSVSFGALATPSISWPCGFPGGPHMCRSKLNSHFASTGFHADMSPPQRHQCSRLCPAFRIPRLHAAPRFSLKLSEKRPASPEQAVEGELVIRPPGLQTRSIRPLLWELCTLRHTIENTTK